VTPIQFYAIFIPVVVLYALFIWVLGRRLYEKVPQRLFLILVLIVIGGIVAGVVMMFQPFVFDLFPIGFWFVFLSLIVFMVWSHVQPRTRMPGPPTATGEPAADGESATEI
jgi:hypothetical protein